VGPFEEEEEGTLIYFYENLRSSVPPPNLIVRKSPKGNPEEEEPPFKLLKSINFWGCSSGGWFLLRVLGLETTQQIHSPGGGGFLQSNTHNQF